MSFDPDRPTTPDHPTRNSVALHDANMAAARAAARDAAASVYSATLGRPRSLATVFAVEARLAVTSPIHVGQPPVSADPTVSGSL
jgi:hypothetical protein